MQKKKGGKRTQKPKEKKMKWETAFDDNGID